MNLDEIKQQAAEIAASSDPNFSAAAAVVLQVAEQLEAGALAGSEAQEVLQDINSQMEIIQEMSGLQLKQKLNVAINALITIAAAAA